MRELIPGLWHWTTEHPNLGQEVSSYYVADAAALLDPMVPPEGLAALDGLPKPRHVILTSRHHDRDHDRFVEAFGAEFHVSEHGVREYESEQVSAYAVGDQIAPGITAVANGPIAPDDTVLGIAVDGGALAFADSLISMGGRIGFVPDGLLGDDPEQVKSDITAAARSLLDREFEHLLFAHGDPIVGGGHRELAAFVEQRENTR